VRKEAAVLQMVSDNQKIARLKKSEKLKSLMADDPKLPRCDYCENRGYVRVAPNLDPRVASALARDHNFSGSSGQTNAKYQDEHGNPVNPANVCAACSQCERGKRWKAEYGNFFTCPR
jgi:hypothetical protein